MTRRATLGIALAVAVVGGGAVLVASRRRPGGTVGPWLVGLVGAGASGEAAAAPIASANGVGLNTEALARMMQSEGRHDTDRIARGWVAINDARAKTGGNVYRVITLRRDWIGRHAGKPFTFRRSGFFGEQGAGGRYSTAKASTPETRDLADRLLRGLIPDPTGGATRFVDAGAFSSQRGARKTFAEVDTAWKREGFFRRSIPGTAPDFFVYTRTA